MQRRRRFLTRGTQEKFLRLQLRPLRVVVVTTLGPFVEKMSL